MATPEGEKLLQTVIAATGLPVGMQGFAEKELIRIVEAGGQLPGEVTLEGLRAALLIYLEELASQHVELAEPETHE